MDSDSLTLDEILNKMEDYSSDMPEWEALNELKAQKFEELKPSTKEKIIYFDDTALIRIPNGFSKTDKPLSSIPYRIERRSLLEYHPERRHPIPYCIVRYKKHYFFILREQGSGEMLLIGKMGLLGGHVGKEDIDELSLSKTILNALKRELNEEAGIERGMIQDTILHGLIKGNEGVDNTHLGVVYEIVLNTDKIKTQEDGILTGIWLHQKKLADQYEKFESWAKIVYDHILRPRLSKGDA